MVSVVHRAPLERLVQPTDEDQMLFLEVEAGHRGDDFSGDATVYATSGACQVQAGRSG